MPRSIDAAGFDADTIRELLAELGRRLDARGLHGRIFIIDGAAVAHVATNDDPLVTL